MQITLFHIRGRLVKSLVDEKQSCGRHEVEFDGPHLASGNYFLKLKAREFEKTEKIILLK